MHLYTTWRWDRSHFDYIKRNDKRVYVMFSDFLSAGMKTKPETVQSGLDRTSRRRFLTLGAAAVTATAFSPFIAGEAAAATGQSLIRDPETGDWVRYSRRRAYRYYRANGKVPADFQRQIVVFRTQEKPGTIVVDGNRHFLYLVTGNNQAIRYGIGVGRDGFGWAGIVKVGRMAEWPRWTPPVEMIARDPLAAKWANGMPGGPQNPLGARALYLYDGGRDTIYRIHGTSEPWSIGLNISSGCIRMNNGDVADLYQRVAVGAKVIVLMQNATAFKGV